MFGNELRCRTCNQYKPDRCTCSTWVSNVKWPLSVYKGMYGDGISTDKHRSKEAAQAVCDSLMREGNGLGMPEKAWVTPTTKAGE